MVGKGTSCKESPCSSLLICKESCMCIAAIIEELHAGGICGLWEALSLSMLKAQLQNTGYIVAAALVIMSI